MRTPPRMLVIFTAATALVVGAVIALATGSWWILPLVILAHVLATLLVLAVTGKALTQYDKPDPNVEAREEPEGDGEPDPDEPRMAI
jgi:membrane protein implicated in regulation of membrane protease activity